MSDFIREVDEDYRRERILGFLSRFQVPLAILVVGIIVGAGVWRGSVDRKVAAAEADNARYAAAEQLAKDGKTQAAEQAFDAVAKSGPAGYALLARLRVAALQAPSDREAAAKTFDDIANDDTIEASMRDAARLRGAMLRVDIEPPAAFVQRYGRFSSTGSPFHASMNELLALSSLKGKDFKAAGGYIDAILTDSLAPPGLRNRAQAFRALVTGGATTPLTGATPPARVAPVGGSAGAAAPSATAPSNPPPPSPAAPPTTAAKPDPNPPTAAATTKPD